MKKYDEYTFNKAIKEADARELKSEKDLELPFANVIYDRDFSLE